MRIENGTNVNILSEDEQSIKITLDLDSSIAIVKTLTPYIKNKKQVEKKFVDGDTTLLLKVVCHDSTISIIGFIYKNEIMSLFEEFSINEITEPTWDKIVDFLMEPEI